MRNKQFNVDLCYNYNYVIVNVFEMQAIEWN